jgi:hypothetical protein
MLAYTGEWISIDDAVPELEQRHDAWHYSGRDANHGAFVGHWSKDDIYQTMKVRGYSHWMVLPDKPNETNTRNFNDETPLVTLADTTLECTS